MQNPAALIQNSDHVEHVSVTIYVLYWIQDLTFEVIHVVHPDCIYKILSP